MPVFFNKKCLLIGLLNLPGLSSGQQTVQFADSIRRAYNIPELAYAVVNQNSVLDIAFLGHHSINLPDTATVNDRFHIGSDTKAMTAFIIAKFVEKNKLQWDTRFFDLFPGWKSTSNSSYYNITLQDLLSHRAGIQPFTEDPDTMPSFTGNNQEKRMKFGQYVLSLNPVMPDSGLHFTYSNAGYTLATLMVEKVSGKSWEELVLKVFNRDLKIDTKFSWPENLSKKDTWGHVAEGDKLVPVPSDTDYRLDYTEPAGDINLSLPDYIKFVQLNIHGLSGKNNYLDNHTYQFIHKGIENYSIGWYNIYENGQEFSTHAGTAGTYFSLVSIDRKRYVGYIIFTNAATESAVQGVRLLMRKLKENYGS
ncbi:MAG: serine hydrolase domain-containing protein [Chitinophagales bacterium]